MHAEGKIVVDATLSERGKQVLRGLADDGSLFFFFQAADGIRDSSVTGVQTCALPISASGRWVRPWVRVGCGISRGVGWFRSPSSEARRVGKECRSRWSPYQ